jgi:hypothetical protein
MSSCRAHGLCRRQGYAAIRSTRPGQEDQISRFLLIVEERLRGVLLCARMVKPRARSVSWIARSTMGKSDGIFFRADPVPKTALQQGCAAGGCVLQKR